MRVEKALEIINKLGLYKGKLCEDCHEYCLPWDDCGQDAINKAKGALKKQVPKKPVRTYCGTLVNFPIYRNKCKVCEGVLDEDLDVYCKTCGQKIDWGKTNEK